MTDPPLLYSDLPLDRRLELLTRGGDAVFVTGEDNLRLRSLNSAAGVTLTCSGRFVRLDGTMEPFEFKHTPNTDRTAASTLWKLGMGWLIDARIGVYAGTPITGQCWAILELVRGFTGAITDHAGLVSGYVTSAQPIAYPRGALRGTLEGPGWIRSITGTDPAANVQISEVVPTGARWRLIGMRFNFTTDATVADRTVRVTPHDGANDLAILSMVGVQAASLSNRYTLSAGVNGEAVNANRGQIALGHNVILMAGWGISTSTNNMQAGDNYSAPQLHVEEWLEGA